MAARVQRGRAVTILRVKDDGGFELDLDTLRRVLLSEHVRDMPVVVISVAGGLRRGESLLLDFLLHYLRNGCPNDWLESCAAGLDDFNWSGNFERHTAGVLVWDEVFQVTMPDGRTVAVLLMDTQGGVDGHYTAEGCAAFLTLSAMLSSVLIYNLWQNIREEDLQHLWLIAEYGQLAAKDITPFQKPFQKLVFLVRDWCYPFNAPYGPDGGLDILHQRLKAPAVQTTEMRIVREHIDACFKRKGCFLLPYPWREMTTDPALLGRLSCLSITFREQVQKLVRSILAPQNLLVKEVNGREITCQELTTYLQVYTMAFSNDRLPKPMCLREATGIADNAIVTVAALGCYVRNMSECMQFTGRYKSHRSLALLTSDHEMQRASALRLFDRAAKIGGVELSQAYQTYVSEVIDEVFARYTKNIDKKASLAAMMQCAISHDRHVGSHCNSIWCAPPWKSL